VQLSAASTSKKRIRFTVSGVVQGVGFRPFVYQLADKYTLSGFVSNSGKGVSIEVEGSAEDIKAFYEALVTMPPPLARIESCEKEEIMLQESEGFIIQASSQSDSISSMLPVDVALCDACRAEMKDPNNRRYKYPFINCTDCGPRYTIIDTLPYDRKNTSMKFFGMCEACVLEYIEPSSRRYHAQPISCYECGPQLFFIDLEEKNCRYESDVIALAVKKLQSGKTIALKGLGGFHIICDATNKEAVESLRERKHRPSKPLAVMAASIEAMLEFALLSESEISKLSSKERPIVVVSKKQNRILADAIAPNIDKIGLFLPYTPLHELLLEAFGKPIVATSANLSDEPIITDEQELLQKLSFVVDGVVTHDRDIRNACDDSVMMDIGGDALFLRLARGYAPKSIYHQKPIEKNILAFGANQKSTVALSFGHNTILSPHIGDLNSIDAVNYFQETIATFERIYEFVPEIVVCDKHPNYESTKLAHAYAASHPKTELIELQHHYAHALAVMAEYGLEKEVLAFCFDGTGYGDDGTLWGGEVLRATPTQYSRFAHLQTLYLLGGEKAVREPRRVGLSLLFELFTFEELKNLEHPLVTSFTPQELKTLHMMHTKGINRPASSSVGRLFDGVYALSGFLEELGFEGESGLILEKIAMQYKSDESYPFTIEGGVIEYTEMVREIVFEKEPKLIAAKFINTLCEIIILLAQQNRELSVVLCGGVFQNRVLVEKLKKRFESHSIEYYIAKETPVNDGAISLGQAYYVRKILEQKSKDNNE